MRTDTPLPETENWKPRLKKTVGVAKCNLAVLS